MTTPFPWWYPVGAQVSEGGTAFRVWANTAKTVCVLVNDAEHPMERDENGYFSTQVRGAKAGNLYRFRVDGEGPFPDPASRFQPEGPHGPSQVVDPCAFAWTDKSWQGLELHGQILYELHVGTFTREGTLPAAAKQLAALADLGITVVEIMPVTEFAGSFGWGYDGVDLFAPTRNYGTPDDLRWFVDTAHNHGLGVILDVVYNHLGPDGNYLPKFSKDYFTDDHHTDWGAAINFDGPNCGPVREFYAANAAYWIKEYHFDGLRLDATQNIYDESKEHIISVISENARRAAEPRKVILVAENEPQHVKLIKPRECGGYGLDGLWNDDFHHAARVAITGDREGYYHDYSGSAQELLSATKYGFLYQGQWYPWQKKRRGTSTLGTDCAAMIAFVQNHDQISNSARGLRLRQITSYGKYKAITALCLLVPGTPMLFQGQEFAASSRFLFFAGHGAQLGEMVRKGRAEFLEQFRSLAQGEVKYEDPCSRATFEKCKLNFAEREEHAEEFALHRDLITLRKSEPLIARQSRQFDGAVLGPQAIVLRFFSEGFRDDRLLVVNLGAGLELVYASEPLLGPPEHFEWAVQWSTEDARYGGKGTPALDSELGWMIPAEAAVYLRPVQRKASSSTT